MHMVTPPGEYAFQIRFMAISRRTRYPLTGTGVLWQFIILNIHNIYRYISPNITNLNLSSSTSGCSLRPCTVYLKDGGEPKYPYMTSLSSGRVFYTYWRRLRRTLEYSIYDVNLTKFYMYLTNHINIYTQIHTHSIIAHIILPTCSIDAYIYTGLYIGLYIKVP